MQFLNYDSPFISAVNRILEYVLLGLLWVVASVPLLTAGAATTAMYYTAETAIIQNGGRLFATFWTRFAKEFKQATLLWLISFLLTAALALNGLLIWRVELHEAVYAVLVLTVVLGTGWMLLWFGYLSKFEDGIADVLLNTFRIALSAFPKVLVLILLFVATAVGAFFAALQCFPVLLLVPGIYVWLSSAVLRSIFKPWLPAADRAVTEEK